MIISLEDEANFKLRLMTLSVEMRSFKWELLLTNWTKIFEYHPENRLKCLLNEQQFCWLCRTQITTTRRTTVMYGVPFRPEVSIQIHMPTQPTSTPQPTSITPTKATTIKECELCGQVSEAFTEMLIFYSEGNQSFSLTFVGNCDQSKRNKISTRIVNCGRLIN